MFDQRYFESFDLYNYPGCLRWHSHRDLDSNRYMQPSVSICIKDHHRKPGSIADDDSPRTDHSSLRSYTGSKHNQLQQWLKWWMFNQWNIKSIYIYSYTGCMWWHSYRNMDSDRYMQPSISIRIKDHHS